MQSGKPASDPQEELLTEVRALRRITAGIGSYLQYLTLLFILFMVAKACIYVGEKLMEPPTHISRSASTTGG